MRVLATQDLERELLSSHRLIAGMDEVGRGALAGPVTVGVALVDATVGQCPEGLADSKVLRPAQRVALCEPIRRWAVATGVGHASSNEIDRWGIVAALRIAGQRALVEALEGSMGDLLPDMIVLDGIHDWFTEPPVDLFSALETSDLPVDERWSELGFSAPPVRTQVKADLNCAVVAAASILAKVERDTLMSGYDDPGYGWASNKGYASAGHIEGLRTLGPSDRHRLSWKLPGVENT